MDENLSFLDEKIGRADAHKVGFYTLPVILELFEVIFLVSEKSPFPIGSMRLVYLPTFTIQVNQM